MNANDLLLWMSARCEGSWSQFRSAVEEFHLEAEASEIGETIDDMTGSDLPLYQAVRLDLQRLAHVEFFIENSARYWRVVPPALAVIQKEGHWVGIACGARFPFLYERLSELAGPGSCDSQGISGMPDCIRVIAEDVDELCRTAGQVGFTVQMNAPNALLAAIPPVDDPRSRSLSEPPAGPGWLIEHFSTSKLGWEKTDLRDLNLVKTGFFRFQMKYQRSCFLRLRGRTYQVPVQVGKYAVLRHRRVRNLILYNCEKSAVSFPLSCRPPLLIERALILCSGLLPRPVPKSSRLEYTQVPEDTARLAAGLLCQEIQIL